eukprot:1811334-Pyramimonas_sp.AAC.1
MAPRPGPVPSCDQFHRGVADPRASARLPGLGQTRSSRGREGINHAIVQLVERLPGPPTLCCHVVREGVVEASLE